MPSPGLARQLDAGKQQRLRLSPGRSRQGSGLCLELLLWLLCQLRYQPRSLSASLQPLLRKCTFSYWLPGHDLNPGQMGTTRPPLSVHLLASKAFLDDWVLTLDAHLHFKSRHDDSWLFNAAPKGDNCSFPLRTLGQYRRMKRVTGNPTSSSIKYSRH